MARTTSVVKFCLYSYLGKEIWPVGFQLSRNELTVENLIQKIGEELQLENVDDLLFGNYSVVYVTNAVQGIREPMNTAEGTFAEFVKFARKRTHRVYMKIMKKTTNSQNDSSLEGPKISRMHDLNEETIATIQDGQLLDLTDFTKIFGYRANVECGTTMKEKLKCYADNVFVGPQSSDIQLKYKDEQFDKSGLLKVERVHDYEVATLLKNGAKLLVQKNDQSHEYLLMQFMERNWSTPDRGLLRWQIQGTKYECNEIVVPVNITGTAVMYDGLDNAKLIKQFDSILGSSIVDQSDNLAAESQCFPAAGRSSSCPEKPEPNQTGIAETETVEPPVWLSRFLNKFKEQLMGDVSKMTAVSTRKYDVLDGSPVLNAEEHSAPSSSLTKDSQSKIYESLLENLLNRLSLVEEHVYSIEDVVKASLEEKPKDVQSEFVDADDRDGIPYFGKWPSNGKVIEVGTDLYVLSKCGFKIKMPPNCSHSLRLVLVKHGKYRNSNEELGLIPQILPNGIECYVKPIPKCNEKSPAASPDKTLFSYHDVRIKTKEKHGKFRCHLNVVQNGKVCGHPIRLDIRVKKFYPKPEPADSFFSKPNTSESLFRAYLDEDGELPFFVSPPRASKKRTRYGKSVMATSMVTHLHSKKKSSGDKELRQFVVKPQDDGNTRHTREVIYSVISSDSEDTDYEETKVGAIAVSDEETPTDVGEQTKATCAAPPTVYQQFENEDSDSSVSLLLDEQEARSKMTVVDNAQVVQLPRCFVVNANSASLDPVNVRVKRKVQKSADVFEEKKQVGFAVVEKPFKTAYSTGESFATCSLPRNIESGASSSKCASFSSPYRRLWPQMNATADSSPNLYTESVDELANDAMNCDQMGNETVGKKDAAVEPDNVPSDNCFKTEDSSIAKNTQSVNILPDKVFEMTSNVFKSVLNTMKPQADGVRENMQRTFDEFMSVASVGATPPPPPPPPPGFEIPASSSCVTSSSNIPVSQPLSSSSPVYQRPLSPRRESVDVITEALPADTRRNVPMHVQRQLDQLNEMGFTNDSYNLFLLSQYPNNMDKVVESLVNYNDSA